MTIDKDAVGYAPDHPAVLASLEAMALDKTAWEARRDECYAWLRVLNAIDPDARSNVRQHHVHWRFARSARHQSSYQIQLSGPWGKKTVHMHAPSTLEDARTSPLLAKAVAERDRLSATLTAEHGESHEGPNGRFAQVRLILQATRQGREKLSRGSEIPAHICEHANTAEAYSLDEWSPKSSRQAHVILRAQPDRGSLVASGIKVIDAQALVTARRGGTRAVPDPFRPVTPVRAQTRGRTELPEDLKLELGIAYEAGVTLDDVVAFWSSLSDDVTVAVAA